MILLDAYALVALFSDEPAADQVSDLLRQGGCVSPLVNVSESVDVLCRVHGLPFAKVAASFGQLSAAGVVTFVSPDQRSAFRAAEIRQAHYSRRACEVSIADCFLVAEAQRDDSIATADPALAVVARLESIDVIALPDSSNRRPV